MIKQIVIELTDSELAGLVIAALAKKLEAEGQLPWEPGCESVIIVNNNDEPIDFSSCTIILEQDDDDNDDEDEEDEEEDPPGGEEVLTSEELEEQFKLETA